MTKHSHQFVESYEGLVGFGMDRQTDEATIKVYLQKLSDDNLLQAIVPRMSDRELEQIFEFVNVILRKHLREEDHEYHSLFLKD